MPNSIITATGSYIPILNITNEYFLNQIFYDTKGIKLKIPNIEIIRKFQEITCISERRYVTDELNTSDIAFIAAKNTLEGVEKESLDYIIVAQNLGDVKKHDKMSDMIPTIAARVKHKLGIRTLILSLMMSPLVALGGCIR